MLPILCLTFTKVQLLNFFFEFFYLLFMLIFGVWGLGFGVWGLGFGVWGLGLCMAKKIMTGTAERPANQRKHTTIKTQLRRIYLSMPRYFAR